MSNAAVTEWDWFTQVSGTSTQTVSITDSGETMISLLQGGGTTAVWQKKAVDVTGLTKVNFDLSLSRATSNGLSWPNLAFVLQ